MNVNNLEIKRKIMYFSKYLSLILIPIILILIAFWIASMTNGIYYPLTISSIIILSLSVALQYFLRINILNTIKNEYVEKALQNDFDDLHFQNIKINNNEEVLKILGLNSEIDGRIYMVINLGRKAEQFDFLSGNHNNIHFIQNRLRVTKSDIKYVVPLLYDDRHIVTNKTLFDGIITEIDLGLSDYPIFISTKKNNKLNILTYKISSTNEEFNKKFNITCDKKEEAIKLLNDTVTNNILKLADCIPTDKFFILLYKNKMYIGQNNIKAFEPNLKEKIDEESIKNTIYNHSKYIKEVINFLKK